jgi:hypothetical protein
VDFQSDDDFPIAGGTGDQSLGIGRTCVDKGHMGLQGAKMKSTVGVGFNNLFIVTR